MVFQNVVRFDPHDALRWPSWSDVVEEVDWSKVVDLIEASSSRCPYIAPHRAVQIAICILPHCIILLIFVFSMESFVTVTDRRSRGGGSSHASSSRTKGKAPAVPQKRINQGSGGRRRKRAKTTVDAAGVESLTYYKVKLDSKPEVLAKALPKPAQILLHRQQYYKVTNITSQRHGKKKSSHIWGEGKGFMIIQESTSTRFYYCCQCLNKKKNPTYKPLSKRLSTF